MKRFEVIIRPSWQSKDGESLNTDPRYPVRTDILEKQLQCRSCLLWYSYIFPEVVGFDNLRKHKTLLQLLKQENVMKAFLPRNLFQCSLVANGKG